MAERFTPVVFNEGAPLDPSKLNDLQNNLASLVQDVGGLKNTTLDATYTIVMDAGYVELDLDKEKISEAEVKYNATIFKEVPQITISVGSSISATTDVRIGLKDARTKPTIQVIANTARTNFRVNWIATEKKYS